MSGRRAFNKNLSNVKQVEHTRKTRRVTLIRLLREARGQTRPYKLGDAVVQTSVLINRAQGTLEERSHRYKAQLEARHDQSVPQPTREQFEQDRTEHLLRQVLLSQGPLTAERVYAAALTFQPDLQRDWRGRKAHHAFTELESLRRERYIFRVTMARWKKTCALAGHADGSQLGVDRRPIADDSMVYIPREVFLPISQAARYHTGAFGNQSRSLLYHPELKPSPKASARAKELLPIMARLPSRWAARAARSQYLEDMRARFLALKRGDGIRRAYPRLERYSMASERLQAARASALAQLDESARNYLQEPYVTNGNDSQTSLTL